VKRSTLIKLAKFGVAGAILAVLFAWYGDDVAHVLRQPKDMRWFAGAVLTCLLAVFITFFRWYLLVWAQEIPFRLTDAVRFGFVGLVSNLIMPGMVGGDLVKALLIARQQKGRRTAAVATVMVDRFVGLVALFYVGALAGILGWARYASDRQVRILVYVLWTVSGGATLASTVMLSPAVYRWSWLGRLSRIRWVGGVLADLLGAMALYSRRRRVFVLVMGLSMVSHLGFIGSFYMVARALQGPDGYCPDLLAHCLILPLALFAGSVVPLMGGLGVVEGALAWLYGVVAPAHLVLERARGQGVANSLAYRVIQLLIAAVGASFYFRRRREISQAVEVQNER
jgi:uncharacterized protein (TIRG00374 family)